MLREKKIAMTDNQSPLLEVKNLTKCFPIGNRYSFQRKQLYALDDVSLKVYKGETVGVIGESGCGKSTLSRCLVSLHKPTSGSIYFNNKDISKCTGKEKKEISRKIQMIFQDPYSSLDPKMRISQLVMEPFTIHNFTPEGQSRVDRAIELLQSVGLDRYHLQRYPHEFSGGQRQRINIARALTLNPEVLICDEPVSALDVSIQAQVLNLLIKLQQEFNLTYLFISHDLSVIRYISDYIAVMYLGHIVEFCEASGIYTRPLHPYTQALLSSIPPSSPFEKKERLELKGDLVSHIGKVNCCPLASRCPHCTERCKNEKPKLKPVDGRHEVACFLYEQS